MMFVHDDPDFEPLLRIVAEKRRLPVGLVEKDYWVTHSLWALHAQGYDVWFKGGTSLSKGFGLIERFSEDLDLKVEPGRVEDIEPVKNWKSEGKKAIAERTAYFGKLAGQLAVPGATARLGPIEDPSFRSANIQVLYPGRHISSLTPALRPFVLLEVGSARVTPHVARDMTSFVHEHLEREGLLVEFEDNRPRGIRCVHPLVTLLEKLDALMRRFPRIDAVPATFVRHFEDAARIVRSRSLPPLPGYTNVRALAEEMLAQRQIAALPSRAHPALAPADDGLWREVLEANEANAPMYWGPRLSLEDSCAELRAWIAAEFE